MRLQMHGLAGFFKNVINPFPSKPMVSENEQPGTSTPKDESSNRPLTENMVKAQPGKVTEKARSERPTTTSVEHDTGLNETRETVYDLIKDIRDPEKPQSLEELDVVSEENICVCKFDEESLLIQITFVPTVPHCSLASLIGLCLRQKLIQDFPEKHKLDIYVKEGSHETADDVNKQINDKERIAAALENPNLRELVDSCISNDFG